MAYVKTDLKSPRDLCLHLAAEALAKTKAAVEKARNDARDYDGTSPADTGGAWSPVGLEDHLGSCKDFS